MKKTLPFIVLIFLVLSCSKQDVEEISDNSLISQKLLSIAEINSFIENQLKTTGDVIWTKTDANILFSAVIHGGGVLSVGYGEEGENFVVGKRSATLEDALQNVYDIVQEVEGVSKSNETTYADEVLNYVDIGITKLETIQQLQKTDYIRYLEPVGYSSYLQQNTSKNIFGCDKAGYLIHDSDYSLIAPKALLPWNFKKHNIDKAWQYSTGSGITIGLIDTGISPDQILLGDSFNNGFSSGRTIERYGTFENSPWGLSTEPDGPDDKCGHGTSIASAMVSPRNTNSMPVGVAYNANLVAYRGTGDVILQGYQERKGVCKALKALAEREDVKIIAMAIGFPWAINNVKDAVKYAYRNKKLIIAAGGTSTTFTNWYGSTFPGSMSETVAVTGLKDDGYYRCDVCHDGNRIDFTIIMQRSSSGLRNLPVLGFHSGDQIYVSGSSAATAVTAGIAALVWARYPDFSREQVVDKLKNSGEFYPNKDKDFGYGNIDALKAVK